MNLIIDVGNTRVKIAVFKDSNIIFNHNFNKRNIISEIKNLLKNYTIDEAIISTVALISDKKLKKIQNLVPLLQVDSKTKIPFKNLYSTPKTLGVDRIALVCAALHTYPNQDVLVIDAGTCITFDFINRKKEYLGGAISPGIEMRYKALNKFTSKLPLLKINTPNHFIGNSTNESIHSGVVNGIIHEIDGVIQQYKNKYLHLTVVLTGGDANFLSKQLKSSIFANQNFLLEGLNKILIFNKNE